MSSENKDLLDKMREESRDADQEQRTAAELAQLREFEEAQRRRAMELDEQLAAQAEREAAAAKRREELEATGMLRNVVNMVGLFCNFGEEPGLEIWTAQTIQHTHTHLHTHDAYWIPSPRH